MDKDLKIEQSKITKTLSIISRGDCIENWEAVYTTFQHLNQAPKQQAAMLI